MSFRSGFEKTSSLKKLIAAATIAAAPAGAKANMGEAVRDAFTKTPTGQSAAAKLSQYGQKLRSTRLLGKPETVVKGAKGSAAKAHKGASLDLKDGRRLELSYKDLRAHAQPGDAGVTADLGKGRSLSVSDKGGDKSLMFGYRKDF